MATKAKIPQARKPRELKLYRLKNPDFYEKMITAYSEEDAALALGGKVDWIDDAKLLKKMRRRPGVVFRKLATLKRDWEAWE